MRITKKNKIQTELFKHQDLKYKDFSSKLTPTISKENFIGVRVPILRKLAKEFNIQTCVHYLPHKYVEENTLHGLVISNLTDYNETIKQLNTFLPYVNNWATCDIINPKSFKKNKTVLKKDIIKWLNSDKTYTLRFGIEMVMTHFLDEDFDISLMKKIAKIRSEEYYVNMMIAWYFATALTKQWDSALPFLLNHELDTWTHNKTLQKSRESYRISKKQKDYLKTLKLPQAKHR